MTIKQSAIQKWEAVSGQMDVALLMALLLLWFDNQKLSDEDEEKLRAIFEKYPLGQRNFKTWVKQTIRQMQENAATVMAGAR